MHGRLTATHESPIQEMHSSLVALCEELGCLLTKAELCSTTSAYPECTAERIEEMLRARRAREKIFGNELFADPAWDILLVSFVAHLRHEKISVSGLCGLAAVPASTALRWVVKLEQDGLLTREHDPMDHRRTWIRITAVGTATMLKFFSSVKTAPLLV